MGLGLVCRELWGVSWSAQVQSHLMRVPYLVWLSVPSLSSLLPLWFPGQPCGCVLELQLTEIVTLDFRDQRKTC